MTNLSRCIADVGVFGEEKHALLIEPTGHAARIVFKKAELVDLLQSGATSLPLLLEVGTELVELGHRLTHLGDQLKAKGMEVG